MMLTQLITFLRLNAYKMHIKPRTQLITKLLVYRVPVVTSVSYSHNNRSLKALIARPITMQACKLISHTLSREYRVAGYWYSRLLFTSEDRLCANLRVQWQSTNMTSQYQFLAFAWRHRSIVVTSQCWVRKCHPWQQWRNELSMIVFSGFVCLFMT